MPGIDMGGLAGFDRLLGDILEEVPERRRELHEMLADAAHRHLETSISASGVNDSRGNVRRWQIKHVGSGGGYAAVRPAGSKDGAATGPNGPAAVTGYLDGGHKIRRPQAGSKYYLPRINVAYVSGYHFYDSARVALEADAIRLAQEYVNRLADRMEGGG